MTSRALLLGVPATTYRPGGKRFPALPSVLQDVRAMESMLTARGVDQLEAPPPPIMEAQASEALQSIVSATSSGDLGIIYFSGHGWAFPDNGDTADEERDESLVFADRPLVDDWARVHLWPLAKPGARFVVILDACHSETALLTLDRFPLPAPPKRADADLPYWRLILAACADEATTLAATDIGGATTLSLIHELRRDPAATYRNLWPRVTRTVLDRFSRWRVGAPVQRYAGPDDSLLDSVALAPIRA